MPPRKRGAKAASRGRGRGKKKVEEEVVDEEVEQTDEDKDTSMNAEDGGSQDNSMDAADQDDSVDSKPEPEEVKQEDADASQEMESSQGESETDADTSTGQKRKAEEENGEDEEESAPKKIKTEEDDPNKMVTLFCGNLDADLTTESLSGFFEANDVPVENPRKIGVKRFGYVDVKKEYLEKALEIDGKELNGEAIRIDISKPKGNQEESRGQGGDSRTMFVKNLKENITEDDLRKFFEGEVITEIRLPKKRDGTCKGFGYVVFETEEALEKMMTEKQGAKLEDEELFLDYTDEKSSHQSGGKNKEFGPSKVLFVRNLAFQVTEDELKEIFDGCKACRIPPNEYGQSKGFGFVEFETVESAESAKADKDGLEIQGRVVQLAFANDKPGGNAGAGTDMAKRYGGSMRGGRGSWGGGGGWGGGSWGGRGGWGGGGGWGGRGGGGWGGRGGGGWGGGRGGGFGGRGGGGGFGFRGGRGGGGRGGGRGRGGGGKRW